MKKITSAFVVSVLCALSAGFTSAFADDSNMMFGDCNSDGMIDATDASDILVYYSAVSTGGETGWSEEKIINSDVNYDGKVDASDASAVLTFYSYVSTGGKNSIEDFLTEEAGKFEFTMPEIKISPRGGNVFLYWNENDGATGYDVKIIKNSATECEYYGSDIPYPSGYEQTVLDVQDCKRTDGRGILTLPKLTFFQPSPNTYRFANVNRFNDMTVEITPYVMYGNKKISRDYPAYYSIDPNEFLFRQYAGDSHNDFAVYDEQGDSPVFSWTSYISNADRKILADFEKEHFTGDMSAYQRLKAMEQWIYDNFTYASTTEDYNKIANSSYVNATLVQKTGQCLQYDGALAGYMVYKGYNVRMIQGWVFGSDNWQHFWANVEFPNGNTYTLDLGI
ncbi:MAG: hypothetical protein K2N49_05100 [Ruminococcus sp.]|nr:hypothetical protein [Ruminococcus sp.]MDE7226217.1 hypothetical protein [Ruminococcus sp.]